MTPKVRRQLGLLAVLVAVLVLAIIWARPGGAPTAGIRGAPSNATAPESVAAGAEVPVSDVNLEQLRRQRRPVPAPRRNPFQFQAAPAPRGATASVPRFDDVPPPMPSVGPPPVPPIPVRFIGVFESPSRGRVGMFIEARTAGQGVVFHAREGDVIEGRYRVLQLGPESAELARLDGQGRQTIRQSGQ